jgi:hypothetical protein
MLAAFLASLATNEVVASFAALLSDVWGWGG